MFGSGQEYWIGTSNLSYEVVIRWILTSCVFCFSYFRELNSPSSVKLNSRSVLAQAWENPGRPLLWVSDIRWNSPIVWYVVVLIILNVSSTVTNSLASKGWQPRGPKIAKWWEIKEYRSKLSKESFGARRLRIWNQILEKKSGTARVS